MANKTKNQQANEDYWIRRQELTLITQEKKAETYLKDVKRQYSALSNRIETELNAFYGKYATENKISIAETKKRLKPDELKSFRETSEDYYRAIKKLGVSKDHYQFLRDLSAKSYVSRYEELQSNIRAEIELMYINYNDGTESVLNDNYKDTYYRTLYNKEMFTGVHVAFAKPTNKLISNAVNQKWLGSNYSDDIYQNKDKLLRVLNQEIPQQFAQGKGSRATAKVVRDRLGISYREAYRLVTTETNHIANQSNLKAYEEGWPVQEYRYVATLDTRTSSICRDLDDKVFPTNDAEVGINFPPMHPHCRSVTIPEYKDDDLSVILGDRRAARNQVSGRTELVSQMSYKEWYNKYVKR